MKRMELQYIYSKIVVKIIYNLTYVCMNEWIHSLAPAHKMKITVTKTNLYYLNTVVNFTYTLIDTMQWSSWMITKLCLMWWLHMKILLMHKYIYIYIYIYARHSGQDCVCMGTERTNEHAVNRRVAAVNDLATIIIRTTAAYLTTHTHTHMPIIILSRLAISLLTTYTLHYISVNNIYKYE
jgi:hypothetical protein